MNQRNRTFSRFKETDFLALDFDGVVVDSIRECLVVGFNALAIQQDRPERINSLDELEPDIVRDARRIRKFIRHGQDFVFIHLALHQKHMIEDQNDFDRFLNANKSLDEKFRKLFYSERARFYRDEPEMWLALNPFFPGMAEFIQSFQPKERLYIITTKLKENAEAIIEGANLGFIRENIYSADPELSKTEIIERLIQKYQINPVVFHFIEDQVDTLIKCKSTGVNLYLAQWGYNNDEQVRNAKDENIRVLSLNDFLEIFAR